MATPWREIKHKFSEEERVRIQQEAVAELERMGFGKLRLARQQTQLALAERLDIPQTAVTRNERIAAASGRAAESARDVLHITEIAYRGRRQQAIASARLGYLDGVEESAKIAAEGSSSPSALIDRVGDQIVQVMGLAGCRFDYGMGLGFPRLESDGHVRWRDQVWDVDTHGLPVDKDTELFVESGGAFMGRFLLKAHQRSRPSRAERMVAAALAAQVGGALRAYRDARAAE